MDGQYCPVCRAEEEEGNNNLSFTSVRQMMLQGLADPKEAGGKQLLPGNAC